MNDVTSYLQTVTDDSLSNVTDMLLQWLVVPSIVFMIIIIALYTWRSVRHYRVEKAIFEIRDSLKDIQAQQFHTPHTATPEDEPATTSVPHIDTSPHE